MNPSTQSSATATIRERKARARQLLEARQLPEALDAYRDLGQSVPDDPEVWHFLGIIHALMQSPFQAEQCFRDAIDRGSPSPHTYFNLAKLVQDRGGFAEAIQLYQRTLDLQPGHFSALNSLGAIHLRQGKVEQAVDFYRRSLAVNPDQQEIRAILCGALEGCGLYREALACCNEALSTAPSDALRIKAALLTPVIADSTDSITLFRANMESQIDALLEAKLIVPNPAVEIATTQFYLSYHGNCNRRLQEKIARLHATACPTLVWSAPHCQGPRGHEGRLRIGFISNFLYNHSIGKTSRGLIEKLARDQFEVHALLVKPVREDPISRTIRDQADHWHAIQPTLNEARHQIAELELDILFYQDIGMDAFTYYLAFSRLAPVQCTSFGHPDTTGIPNLDYWISCELFEPENAQEHYSEKLHLLRNSTHFAYYFRPRVPGPLKPRAAFGLPEDKTVYLCPQMLFKFHPEFDAVLGSILRADPHGQIVLIQGKVRHWAELLCARFERQIPDVASRIVFLPSQSGDDFTNLIAVSDVMLDTPHFNGYNTSLEAFAVGTPVVTIPKMLQRGRHTAGMYARMGISDCVAASDEDYVQIAVRLGTDREFNQHMRRQILERSHVLYEDMNVVREYERFFLEAAQAAGLR